MAGLWRRIHLLNRDRISFVMEKSVNAAEINMKRVKVSELIQCPYGFVGSQRVDPTYEDVHTAIEESRFCQKIMDKDYEEIRKEIFDQTDISESRNMLMRRFHAERVAELVRTEGLWLNVSDNWPIRINQFNHITAGNHRFRAIRYLGVKEIDVAVENADQREPMYDQPEIW